MSIDAKEDVKMKCDELEAYGMNDPAIGDEYEMYKVSDVDAAIAELKAIVTTDNSAVIARLEDSLRKTQRAMWLARANRVLEKIAWFKLWNANISTMNPEDGARQEYDKWKKAFGKCLAKAKEYE